MNEEHDDLLAALAAADPVGLDAVPDPDRTLFEEIIAMEPTTTDSVLATEALQPPRRSRARLAIATAAVVAAAGVGGGVYALGNDSKAADPPATAPDPTDAPTKVAGIEPAPRTGQFGGAAMAMCMVWDVTTGLDGVEYAFDGTVTAIDNGWVTFEVGEWFTADAGSVVVLNAEGLLAGPDGGPMDGGSESVVMITEVGQRFLVSGVDGYANICNGTQPYVAAEADAWRTHLA